jgi:hypothetical protein
LEQELSKKNTLDLSKLPEETKQKLEAYNRIAQLRDEEEKKYNNLKNECDNLNSRVDQNKRKLEELEQLHNTLIRETEIKTEDIKKLKIEYSHLVEKFNADKIEYDNLLTKKEILHTEIMALHLELDHQVEMAKEKLKNPTISDLLQIRDSMDKLFDTIQKNKIALIPRPLPSQLLINTLNITEGGIHSETSLYESKGDNQEGNYGGGYGGSNGGGYGGGHGGSQRGIKPGAVNSHPSSGANSRCESPHSGGGSPIPVLQRSTRGSSSSLLKTTLVAATVAAAAAATTSTIISDNTGNNSKEKKDTDTIPPTKTTSQ